MESLVQKLILGSQEINRKRQEINLVIGTLLSMTRVEQLQGYAPLAIKSRTGGIGCWRVFKQDNEIVVHYRDEKTFDLCYSSRAADKVPFLLCDVNIIHAELDTLVNWAYGFLSLHSKLESLFEAAEAVMEKPSTQVRFEIKATEEDEDGVLKICTDGEYDRLPQAGDKLWFGAGEMPVVTGVVHYPPRWRTDGPSIDIEMKASRKTLEELLARKDENWEDHS